MILYFNIALSFAIASLFFIHRRALQMYAVENTMLKDVIYVILCTLLFPFVILTWALMSEEFIRAYGETYYNKEKK